MRPLDIIAKSDNRSKTRAATQGLTAKLYKVDGNSIIYTVDSSDHDKDYYVTIQLIDLTGNKLRSLKSALSGNVRMHCTCPAFLYQGYKYISYKKGVGINKEDRSPDITNPNKEGLACKHILVALNQLKSDYSSIYSMLKEQIPKGNDKPQQTDIKSNRESKVPTEVDIKLITDFKSACNKLYKDYINYKNATPTKDALFIDSSFYDKVDPSAILLNLSQPVYKSLSNKFIGKLLSLENILKMIDLKRNGFNVLLESDINNIIRKLNETISATNEAFINDIILTLIYS